MVLWYKTSCGCGPWARLPAHSIVPDGIRRGCTWSPCCQANYGRPSLLEAWETVCWQGLCGCQLGRILEEESCPGVTYPQKEAQRRYPDFRRHVFYFCQFYPPAHWVLFQLAQPPYQYSICFYGSFFVGPVSSCLWPHFRRALFPVVQLLNRIKISSLLTTKNPLSKPLCSPLCSTPISSSTFSIFYETGVYIFFKPLDKFKYRWYSNKSP